MSFDRKNDGNICYFSALLPKSYVAKAMEHDSWDLRIGDGQPGFSQSYVSGKTTTRYHRFSCSPAEPLLYIRNFHDLKPRQFDLHEEFRLFHNLYHDRPNDRYIYIDGRGEDDVAAEMLPNKVRAKTRYIRQFIAARQVYLAIFFDHRAESSITVAAAQEKLTNETLVRSDIRFSFNVFELDGHAFSRMVGKKIIAAPPVQSSGIWPYSEEPQQQFADYVIGADTDDRHLTYTSDEGSLADYFGKNPEAPHYLTPVWFRREVLRKYYDHPERYSVEDGYLRCGSLWGLRMDNDLPQHVVVFLGDLGHLAYEEQLYWKSFNVPPASEQSSDTHFRRSYLAEFADPTTPDLVFKEKLVSLREQWERQYGWQLFRALHDDDSHVIKQLRIPLTDSVGEFEHQTVLLTKLLIDSLNDGQLAFELGGALPDEKSISKFERFLKTKNYPHKDRDTKLLRLLQAVRSTAAAHRKGEQFHKIAKELKLRDSSASDIFRKLLASANQMLDDLQSYFIASTEA